MVCAQRTRRTGPTPELPLHWPVLMRDRDPVVWRPTYAASEPLRDAAYGAFVEPSGRNRWQPVADGRTAKTAEIDENRCRRRSEEHTSELQSRPHLVCRLLLEKKKQT